MKFLVLFLLVFSSLCEFEFILPSAWAQLPNEYATQSDYGPRYEHQVKFVDISETEILKILQQNDIKESSEQIKKFTRAELLLASPELILSIKEIMLKAQTRQEEFLQDLYGEKIKAKRILFLADHPDIWNGSYGLSLRAAQLLPAVDVFMTDIKCPERRGSEEWVNFMNQFTAYKEYLEKNQNLIIQKIDHRKSFPFVSDHFDAVVMKSGLCLCSPECKPDQSGHYQTHYTQNCAGIETNKVAYETFLSEVVRILNKKNPEAFALLEGIEYKHEKTDAEDRPVQNMRWWEEAAHQVMEKNPGLVIELLFLREQNLQTGKSDRLFKAIRIKIKKTKESF